MFKHFKCELTSIKDNGMSGVSFVFKLEDGSIKEFSINENIDRIKSRYEDIVKGTRDTIYCSYGVFGNVNISFNNGSVEFFDSPHMYSFSEEDFKKYIM